MGVFRYSVGHTDFRSKVYCAILPRGLMYASIRTGLLPDAMRRNGRGAEEPEGCEGAEGFPLGMPRGTQGTARPRPSARSARLY